MNFYKFTGSLCLRFRRTATSRFPSRALLRFTLPVPNMNGETMLHHSCLALCLLQHCMISDVLWFVVICPGLQHLAIQSSSAFATGRLTKNIRIVWMAEYHYTGIESSGVIQSPKYGIQSQLNLQRPPPPHWVRALTYDYNFSLMKLARKRRIWQSSWYLVLGSRQGLTGFPDCVSHPPYSLGHNVFQSNNFGPSVWPCTDNFSCVSIRCQYNQYPSQQGIFLYLSIIILWWIEYCIVHLWYVSSRAVEESIVTDHVWLCD